MIRRILVLFCALFTLAQAAQAGSMTWKIRAFDRHAVDVAFYSQNRKAVWPGNGQVWTIKDFKVHEFKLSCINGEKICYGGWVRNNDKRYWGVGHYGKQTCKGCCYTCGENVSTPVLNLNE
jgi:hypothetical protein